MHVILDSFSRLQQPKYNNNNNENKEQTNKKEKSQSRMPHSI